jgi:ATP-dependent helicase/nuclease subunit B
MLSKTPPLSSTWITANQRLALYFREQHDQAQRTAGKTVWESLDCLSFKHWILRAYRTLPDATQFVLSEYQELALWENIITNAMDAHPELVFLSAHSLAKTAQSAWRLLKESETPLHLLASADSQEVRVFFGWAAAFEQHCREKNSIDFNTCAQKVIAAVGAQKLVLSAQITLAGFEEVSAQVSRFFSLLSTQCDLKHYHAPKIEKQNIQRISLDSEELELQAMAQWAYQMQFENPDLLIGCVVPDLTAKRHIVERIFNQTFSSGALFNISGGFPLTHFPLIQSAFDILKLGTFVLDMTLLSRLLRSPFLAGAEQEFIARADLDSQLRKTLEPKIVWQSMQYIAKNQGGCLIWSARCEEYFSHYHTKNNTQSAYAWSQYFAEQLQCMGWPGERTLNSTEYQQVQRWYLLLEELSHLDAVLEKPLSRHQALDHLYQLAQSTVFQPKTDKASVQVLGLLEAVGLSFAGLWVSGMTQARWPSSAAVNPFIPFALQRERNMPHASAERELAYSRVLTQHFCQSAKTVMFSHALQKEDQAQRPSALIVDMPEMSLAEFCQQFNFSVNQEAVIDTQALEYIVDDDAPALQKEEVLRGGASLFKYQAACPFQAFARIRLGAASMPLSAFSMTPQERGTCLHAILEKVWRKLGDHQTLCQYDNDALRQFLEPIVNEVLNATATKRFLTLKPRFIVLEQQRLVKQVMAWLALERQRPAFRVVGLESEQAIQFAGLSLKLRVDREDELEDGTRVVIDYKTGAYSPADWFGARPDDPQLPLYGVACEHPIEALAFAQISADRLQFSGISEKECDIPGIQTITEHKLSVSLLYTWNAFFTDMQRTLTHLALDFQKGHAKVDPKHLGKTCRYCDLQSLCRINEK